jgi:hypothetical protein
MIPAGALLQQHSGIASGCNMDQLDDLPLQQAGSTRGGGGSVAVKYPGPAQKSVRKTFGEGVRSMFRETLFPDSPLRGFRKQAPRERFFMALAYVFPVLHWGRAYSFVGTFKDDLVAGLTIGSLSIPQGIAYAKLAGLPPIYGLCKH